MNESIQNPETLTSLTNQLFVIDTQIKEINRSREKLDGTLDKNYDGMSGVEMEPMNVENVLQGLTPQKQIEELTYKAKKIIEKILTIDSSVHP